MNDEETKIISSVGIKLVKNAKGNYQWEIKTDDLNTKEVMRVNDELEKEYGNTDIPN